jgi:hypothetical protein
MRAFLFALVLGLMTLGGLLFTPTKAESHEWRGDGYSVRWRGGSHYRWRGGSHYRWRGGSHYYYPRYYGYGYDYSPSYYDYSPVYPSYYDYSPGYSSYYYAPAPLYRPGVTIYYGR